MLTQAAYERVVSHIRINHISLRPIYRHFKVGTKWVQIVYVVTMAKDTHLILKDFDPVFRPRSYAGSIVYAQLPNRGICKKGSMIYELVIRSAARGTMCPPPWRHTACLRSCHHMDRTL
jgi:hypothetical protein